MLEKDAIREQSGMWREQTLTAMIHTLFERLPVPKALYTQSILVSEGRKAIP